MAGIANSVRIFNVSYRLAWQGLNSGGKRPHGNDLAGRLRDNIQTLMKSGYDDPQEIAAIIVERMK